MFFLAKWSIISFYFLASTYKDNVSQSFMRLQPIVLGDKKAKKNLKNDESSIIFTYSYTSKYFGIILDERNCNLGFKAYHFNYRPLITLRVKG